LAGGEGDRAFARFFPTITIDGCDKRCAARATELFSAPPAVSFLVSDFLPASTDPGSAHNLSPSAVNAAGVLADAVDEKVIALLSSSARSPAGSEKFPPSTASSTCACGSGLPVMNLIIGNETLTLQAIPAIFAMFYDEGKRPAAPGIGEELLAAVKIYNTVPEANSVTLREALLKEFLAYCRQRGE
jgi:hypothetical protein